MATSTNNPTTQQREVMDARAATPPPRPSISSGFVRPTTSPLVQASTIHFLAHTDMHELIDYAAQRGWPGMGYDRLSIRWQELHWTSDGWKTSHVVRSTDVPCPVVNGYFYLPNVPAGTEIEFAVQVGVACHAPQDTAGARDVGDVWFNNNSLNYRQTAR
jgi:hypothetical protein